MIRKKIFLINIIVLFMVILAQKSYAALEIKPSAAANADGVFTNSSVTNSYLLCQKMTEKGESLYGSTVVPHLSTNKDWGAVSYLANSIYGTNSSGQNKGGKISIDGVYYYSTNGNATGVMNWGVNCYNDKLYSQTASLMQQYITEVLKYEKGETTSTLTARDNVTELEKAALNSSRFVEIINTGDLNKGMALAETSGYSWENWKRIGSRIDHPMLIRQGLFGFSVGNGDFSNYTSSGAESTHATFRPVIWNK